jgi:Na+-driven multidrug efflux pump
MIEWAVMAGAVFAAVMLALIGVLPHAFTGDPAVVDRAREIWPLFALMQPANGAVFALDGILIGAGDTRFLMWGMLAASLGAFVPIALLSLALDLGIVGVWTGLLALIAVRLITCGLRFRGGRWAVTGAVRARGATA